MRRAFNIKSVDKMKFSKYIIFKTFVLYILVLCLGCFSVLIFVRGLRAKSEHEYVYSNKDNIDYKVYLKDNDFFGEEYLPKGGKYIASLIDKIDINFIHSMNSEDIVSGSSNYYVTVTMEAREKGKEVIIWSKEETILEKNNYSFKYKDNFSISPNVSINYDKYNSIMNQFKETYGVNIDATLVVTLHTTTNINHKMRKEDIVDNSVATINIPLIDQTIDISMDYKDVDTKTNTIVYYNKPFIHYVLVVCGVILFIYYLYLSYGILALMFDVYNNRDRYKNRISKIFANYDQVIVKVDKLPNISGKSVLNVKTFDDLLDAQNELREPILYNEIVSKQESRFLIVKDDRAFMYKIKYTDFS